MQNGEVDRINKEKYRCPICGENFEVGQPVQIIMVDGLERTCHADCCLGGQYFSHIHADDKTKTNVTVCKTHDKQTDKTQYMLLDFNFLKDMADNMSKGLKNGRNEGDWKRIEWNDDTFKQYVNALLRHAIEDGNWAAVACNAMILNYHEKDENDV